MAKPFKKHGDRYVGHLDGTERAVLAGLIEQTRALLAPEVVPSGDPWDDLDALLDRAADDVAADPAETPGTADEPRDPALARLLPDAHRGDPKVAAEFRQMAEEDLRQHKYATFTRALEAVQIDDVPDDERIELTRAQVEALVVALTDVRLLLAERLGLHTEEDVDEAERAVRADPNHRLAYPFGIYDYLTWLQDALLGALSGRRFLF